MGKDYYRILGVARERTKMKSRRPTESWLSSIILIRTRPRARKKNSKRLARLTTCCPTRRRRRCTTSTERRDSREVWEVQQEEEEECLTLISVSPAEDIIPITE